MTIALARTQTFSLQETQTLAEIFAKSGFFQDTREAAQCVTKIIAGAELGFGPIASMQGVYIVKGRVTLSANLVGAAIQRSGKYGYEIVELSNERCELHFYGTADPRKKADGFTSVFTIEDAQKAGLLSETYKKFPRNMLFARALTNGARFYCPEVFGGPIYTPDELGAETDDDGYVVDGTTGEVIDAAAPDLKPAPVLSKVEAATPAPADPEPAGSRAFEERTQLMQEWNALRTRGMKAGLTIKEVDTASVPLEKLAEWTGLLEDKVIRAESVVGTEVPA